MKKLLCLIFVVAILIAGTSVNVRAHSGDVLTAVNGSTPTIDGSIGSGEWADSATYDITSSVYVATAYVKQDSGNLYVAVDQGDYTEYGLDAVKLNFDVVHDGASTLQTDDIALEIYRSGELKEYRSWGNGAWDLVYPPTGWSAATTSTASKYQVEFSIPFHKIGVTAGVQETLGILFEFSDQYPTETGTNYVWYSWPWGHGSSYNTPSDWANIAVAQGITTIFSEDFEGAFPEPHWLVADADYGNGGDYWGDTFLKSNNGSYSAWCADVGSQLINTTIWTEDFEGAFPTSDYQAVDFNADSGYDSWDDTNYRSHGGAWSAWCAQNGTQSEALPEIVYNWEVHRFDNNMWTDIMRWADLSSFSFATFSFWYWFDTGNAGGRLDVVYHMSNQSGGENTYVPIINGGSSGGWTYSSTIIPSNAVWVMVGFFSDATNCNGEGAYVDDMAVVGCVELPNRSAGMYDDNMEAGMLRQVDLTTYSSVTLSYWYWLSAEPSWDYLKVLYTGPGGSGYLAEHTGNSGGWQYSQVSIPTTAYEVGFLFSSDFSVHNYEGAYVDDVLLVGTKLPPPTVESCDQAGTRKDTFRVTDTVYASVSGYLPNSLCVIYVTQDTTWTDGMSIAPVSVTLTTTWSDGTGHVNAAPVYYPPLALGKYDIVFDVNDNGRYDVGTDALDDNDVEATAGLAVRDWNPGDINHDGAVDIFDIVIVAVEFGHPPPPIVDLRADVNKDGTVDIFDIVVIGIHFGETE